MASEITSQLYTMSKISNARVVVKKKVDGTCVWKWGEGGEGGGGGGLEEEVTIFCFARFIFFFTSRRMTETNARWKIKKKMNNNQLKRKNQIIIRIEQLSTRMNELNDHQSNHLSYSLLSLIDKRCMFYMDRYTKKCFNIHLLFFFFGKTWKKKTVQRIRGGER